MGGWSGLQAVTISGNAVTNIVTGVSGQTCSEGMMCSYACPPGYQKTQWPSTQGSTGQSVGGLSCSGGKLHLTNSALSSSLCMEGTGNVYAQNNAGSVVAICRTDYPGTESETVPTEVEAGATQPLTCPRRSKLLHVAGQVDVRPVLPQPAWVRCQSSLPMGQPWPAPWQLCAHQLRRWRQWWNNVVVYPGYTHQRLTFPIRELLRSRATLSGSCKYENGQYCSASGCNSAGCTVSLHCSLSLILPTFLKLTFSPIGLCHFRLGYICHLIEISCQHENEPTSRATTLHYRDDR